MVCSEVFFLAVFQAVPGEERFGGVDDHHGGQSQGWRDE